MRPIFILVIIILFSSSAYYDLNVGTIPQSISNDNKSEDTTESSVDVDNDALGEISFPYQEVIVESGHTVYGIVKTLHDENFTISAHEVVENFEALNPQVNAHDILIGQAYRFPLYSKQLPDANS